jgi:hypothetical protein
MARSLVSESTILTWGSFAPARSETEEEIKRKMLPSGNFVGKVTSTIDEAKACLTEIARVARIENRTIKNLFVSCEGCHSRRLRIVWRKEIKNYFPDAKLWIVSCDGRDAADPDNPMIFQRHWEVWLLFNIVFGLIYWVPPLLWVLNKINPHQPTKKARP